MNPTDGGLSAARLALAVKRFREKTPDCGILAADPIAIVGIGCRMPGDVRSPQDFWRVLRNGVDAVTEVPQERWSAQDYYDPDPMAPGKTNGRFGGFVSDPALFDPVLFGISPREAVTLDPQQRLLLEVAWEAIQDSGRAPESLTGSRTGVFVGISLSEYERLLFDDELAVNANTCTGAYHSVASGRISFLLDLRGPSVSIDTACSSSLAAIHSACLSLRSGESDLALAGGVTLHLLPEHYLGLARLGMLAPDGRCKAFDAKADGFVPSEGCGLVILKRLSEALADGDRVYAVIRGTATNQDGRTNSLTSPSGLAQQEVVRAALENARVAPSSISYVETHGTGTALGDPIEVEALAAVLGAAGAGARPCVLGAAKTNFGHLEAAAGVTGLIKAALALHHEEIPANLHFEKLNPHISFEGSRFVIPTKAVSWPRGTASRFAGVSSFGFSGTNAHMVIEEAPYVPAHRASNPQTGACVLLLSAKTPDALRESVRQFRHFLNESKDVPLYDVCYSAALRRSHYEERLALTAATHSEMCGLMDDFLEGRSRSGIASGRMSQRPGSIALVCSGQGSQWPRMGVLLYGQEPVFRSAMDECEKWIHHWAGWSLLERLSAPEAESKLAETEYAQPAIFAVEVALARLLEAWGVEPGCVIGHSAGEVAAAHISGALSLEEAVRVVVNRGRIMQPSTGHGKMAAVRLPAAAVVKELALHGNTVSIGAINSPQSTVISGDGEAVEALVSMWRERGVSSVMMPVNYAFHSAQMQPFNEELVGALGTVETHPERVPLISTVLGRKASGSELNATYWGRNIRRTVQFAAAVEAACALGAETFIEVGPHPVLLGSISECTEGLVVSSLRKNLDERTALLASLGALHVAGHPVSWKAVFRDPAPIVALPPYPYQRQRFWVAPRTQTKKNQLHPLVGKRIRSPHIRGAVFEAEIGTASLPYLASHQIQNNVLLPMTAILEMVQQAAFEAFGKNQTLLDITVLKPLPLRESAPAKLQISIEDRAFQVHSLRGEEWDLHASGRVAELTPRDESCEPPAGRDFNKPTSFYTELRNHGAGFGAAFQTIHGLTVANQEAWADVQLGEIEQRDASSYWIHPALLDGCLQTAVAAASSREELFLPFAIDQFECFARGSLEARAHARLKASASGDVLSADIDVRREDGSLIARVSGLHLKRVASPERAEKVYLPEWRRIEPGTSSQAPTGRWMIAGGDGAAQLADALRRKGVTAAVEGGLESARGVVLLVDGREFAQTAGSALSEVQKILRRGSPEPPQVWIVTRGAVTVNGADANDGLFQAPAWGLARTIAMEHPELNCVRVDLDPLAPDFEALATEIANWDGEEEIAIRKDGRYARRLTSRATSSPEPQRWTIPARGSIDNLKLAALERRAPGPGEIEVEVETSALNFRDVLNVLGMYPGDAGNPGAEFCGTVARVGEGVERFRAGDRVMGIALGSLASFVTTPAALVTAVPTGWSSVEAATVPNVFLTVYHCLIHLGQLKRGERVLIHSAAGGVGLAAVQLAKHIGAEVFATAGSAQKRDYLRSLGVTQVFDSRSLDWATDGQSVDLVLNSLAGDFIGASFKLLAEGGRFVEIGKNQIWSQERAASLHKGIEYFIVDLAEEIAFDQPLIRAHFENLQALFESGALRPLPARVFPFGDAPSAFRYMAQAKHTGKIVLRHPVSPGVRGDATYLITGGLGALGLHSAQWLAQRGARNLVLVGRHDPSALAAESIDALRREGVRVETRRADVASRSQIEILLHGIEQEWPPLAGILHAAGVLDDGVVTEQTWERVDKVMEPKARGAWHLHELTASKQLDFFVLFSSVASLTGSPGQCGYAAANAFLDALAHYRHGLGLPALSVNWGAWAESGMAARVEQSGGRRVLPGIRGMSAQRCLATLENVMAFDAPQVAIVEADWSRWPTTRFLSTVVQPAPAPAPHKAPADDHDILNRIEAASPGNRRKVLVEYLRGQVNSLLGLNGAGPFIDERQSLLRMGMDSLMSVEFRNLLASALHRPLTATLLFDYPSIGDLADFLLGAPALEDTRPSKDALLEELETLSDEDAEELLKQELGQL